DVLGGFQEAARGRIADERLEPPLLVEIEGRGAILRGDPGDAGVLAALEPGAVLADEQDRVAVMPERGCQGKLDVIEETDNPDLGRRGDPAAGRFVVQRDVSAGDRQAERETGIAEATNRLGELPEGIGSSRVAVVEAVRDAERAGPGD